MKNLIKFELRKILTKRFAVISVAAVLLLSLILSFSTLHSMYAFDGNGTEETGKAAVEIDKQIALKYEGKLTDNKVQQMMSEFKPTQDLHGRRTREKVKGTKNEYKQVHTDDYILEDGQHEGIVSEELWQKAHTKRMATGIKQPSKIGKDRSHLLTGILKCPICGSSMYTNKHAWTNKDGTYKEVYYYICGRNKQERGHHCDYKASLRKTDIEPLVIEAVKELVSDKYFAKEIEKRIGVQTDTTAIDKELANYESKLKEVDLNKARLEREIDNLPIDARFRERKIHDMTLRLDGLYDTIVELEERIEDAKLRRSSIEMEAITLDNIYKLMLNFGKLYDIISDEEKKNLITYLIKEIQIYPNGESEMPLKSIEFNFPIYRDGQEVRRLLWEKGNTVETVVLLSRAI